MPTDSLFQYISPRGKAHEGERANAAGGATPCLLMVGHGTPNPCGQQGFWTTVRQVAQRLPGTPVAGCFLERVAPDLESALAALAHRGRERVVLAPLLLFAAGHQQRDIPAITQDAGTRLGLHVLQSDVLGCHDRLVELSARRFREALSPGADLEDVLLLMVGRGSREPAATAAMRQFLERRLRHTPVGRAEVAFLALTHPRVEDVLRDVAAAPQRHVVVQPHLLYRGVLWSRLARLMREQRAVRDRQRWTLADCLGCDGAVAEVVVERYWRAVRRDGSGPPRAIAAPPSDRIRVSLAGRVGWPAK